MKLSREAHTAKAKFEGESHVYVDEADLVLRMFYVMMSHTEGGPPPMPPGDMPSRIALDLIEAHASEDVEAVIHMCRLLAREALEFVAEAANRGREHDPLVQKVGKQ
jgi:hypothetical protein